MKKLLLVSLTILFLSCGDEKKEKEIVVTQPVDVKIERFDKLFYESKPEDLQTLKANYPFFFPPGNEDTVWTNKLSNPLLKELYQEVQKKYGDDKVLEKNVGDLVGRIKHFFPESRTPRVITLINEVDREAKAIYADTLAIISLDCYLGKDHRFYTDFPEFEKIGFEESQMLPDLVNNFMQGKIAPPSDRSLLSQMIYYGKLLYAKDELIPEVSDAAKIGYTEQQLDWCKANEAQMWSYFIENKLLYEANQKNDFRFIHEAPFSKFYLEIDNESPGKVGQWLGWQIVRSFMQNNSVSFHQLLELDAKTIFERSKYKPEK